MYLFCFSKVTNLSVTLTASVSIWSFHFASSQLKLNLETPRYAVQPSAMPLPYIYFSLVLILTSRVSTV